MANCTTCTPEKRAKILAALADGASITRAAHAAGVPRSTLYLWRRTDKVFAEAMAEALEAGTDLLEDEALRRGLEYSDALLIFLLKTRRPDKYVRKLATKGHRRVECPSRPQEWTPISVGPDFAHVVCGVEDNRSACLSGGSTEAPGLLISHREPPALPFTETE